MIGEYEQTIREQVIAARQRLYGKPERQVVIEAPPPPKPSQLAWQRILAEVAAKHNVTVDQIRGKTGAYKLAAVRHEAAYRMVVELGLSYGEVGRHMNRDHSLAHNAMKRHLRPRPRRTIVDRPRIAYAGKDNEDYIPWRTKASKFPPPEPWPETPEPVVYDHCEPAPIAKTGDDIINEVCAKYRISRDALFGPLRFRPLCAARHEAAFRMVVDLGYSYPAAGRLLGNRDHTTILNSVRRHASADPAAAIRFKAFSATNDRSEEAMRAEAIALHFGEGASVRSICKRLSVSRLRCLAWLVAEADRRRAA